MTLLIVITNDAERNASRGLVLVRRHTATALVRRHTANARTSPLTDLQEELIMEILSRLPARTLVSLKSVCTSWRNLISSPDFTWNHPLRIACYNSWPFKSSRVRYDSIGVLSVQSIMNNPSEPTEVDYFRGQHYYRMVGSCHGLLCFLDEHDNQNTHAILWNPCTGFTFQSPKISGKAHVCGFGYDHLSDSYKLFGFIRKDDRYGSEFSTRIYTFGPTSSWRRIDDIPSTFARAGVTTGDFFMRDNAEGVCCCSSRACTVNWNLNYHKVVYFDLGKEIYGHFPLPPTNSDDDDYPGRLSTHLCILRNCLSVCYEHLDEQHWIVWQMKEYGDAQSWTTLAMLPFHRKLGNIRFPIQPLYITENDVLVAISPCAEIVMYNLNDGSIDIPVIDSYDDGIQKNPHLSEGESCRMAYIYHENLVSPNGLQSNSSEILRFVKPKPKPMCTFTW